MKPEVKGSFRGDLEVVQQNVRDHGVIERCTFRKGWFSDTLSHHTEPIVLCFVDVDLKCDAVSPPGSREPGRRAESHRVRSHRWRSRRLERTARKDWVSPKRGP